MQRVEAEIVVSLAELGKDPALVLEEACGFPVAVLREDRVVAYMLSAEFYEELLERLDDQQLVKIVKEREGEEEIPVSLDQL